MEPARNWPYQIEVDNVRVIRAAKPVCRRTTERGKALNPEYSIFRDQPTAGASPLRINVLLSDDIQTYTFAFGQNADSASNVFPQVYHEINDAKSNADIAMSGATKIEIEIE